MIDSAREIENLLYLYAERLDAGDLDGVADLFRHGRIRAPAAPDGAAVEGRDAVRRLYAGATRLYANGTPLTRHVTSNVIVEVDEDAGTAATRSVYTVFQRTERLALQPIISGRYHDTFQRIDGRWWFDTRVMFVDLVGDLSQHLLFELRSA
jgi:3-phenylpropionate/cinnamic acid dioxygenase small subunit